MLSLAAFPLSVIGAGYPIDPDERRAQVLLDSLRGGGREIEQTDFFPRIARTLNDLPPGRGVAARELRFALSEYLFAERTLPDSAETVLRPVLEEHPATEVSAAAARTQHLLGQIRFYQQRMPEALACQLRAVAIYKQLGRPEDSNFANAHRLAGELGARVGDFNQAVDNYRAAIDLFERQRDTSAYFFTVHNLAHMLGVKGFYELAEKERRIIFSHAAERGQFYVLALARMMSGIDLMNQERYPEMLAALEEAESALDRLAYDPRTRYFLHRFHLAYAYALEDREHVEPHFRAMQRLFREELNESGRFRNIFARDEATYRYIVGDYGEALRKLEAAFAAVEERTDNPDKLTYYELFKDIHRKLGNQGKALRYAELEAELRDSVRRSAQLTQSAYYENLYEKEQEKLRQAERRAELEKIELINRSRIRAIFSLALITLLLLLAYHFFRMNRFGRREKALQQQFSRDLLATREREQRRIARDLHDGVAQDLLLLQKEAATLKSHKMAGETKRIFQRVRQISHQLYIPGPERLGLRVAIEQLIDRYDRTTPLFYSLDLESPLPELPPATEHHLFAILQEGLQNVMKHARAKAVEIRFFSRDGEWLLQISDNGVGFNPDRESPGIGLRTISERARMMNARLGISSRPGQNTQLQLRFTV